MATYIIETIDEPKRYRRYENRQGVWTFQRQLAAEFDERLRQNLSLPAGGCWVIIDEPTPKRSHFTTIKLRPVVIRLAATEAEYEDLNAQALEFEAALRQWVKGQQILTDGWMVDVLTEDE